MRRLKSRIKTVLMYLRFRKISVRLVRAPDFPVNCASRGPHRARLVFADLVCTGSNEHARAVDDGNVVISEFLRFKHPDGRQAYRNLPLRSLGTQLEGE